MRKSVNLPKSVAAICRETSIAVEVCHRTGALRVLRFEAASSLPTTNSATRLTSSIRGPTPWFNFWRCHASSCAPDRERDLPHQSTGNGFEGVCNSDRSACRSRPCHSGLALHRSAGPGSENEALQIGALIPVLWGCRSFFDGSRRSIPTFCGHASNEAAAHEPTAQAVLIRHRTGCRLLLLATFGMLARTRRVEGDSTIATWVHPVARCI